MEITKAQMQAGALWTGLIGTLSLLGAVAVAQSHNTYEGCKDHFSDPTIQSELSAVFNLLNLNFDDPNAEITLTPPELGYSCTLKRNKQGEFTITG